MVLFIIDFIRIMKRDPVRREWVSLLYLIFFYFLFLQMIKPAQCISLKNLSVFLLACGLALFHAAVTFLNYWFVCTRWNRMVLFYIIAWTGTGGIFIFNLLLIFRM